MRVLIAVIEGERIAVPLETVAAVVAAPACVPLPLAPAHVQGIAAWQGHLLPVADVARLLGLAAAGERGEALVLRREDHLAALLVAGVEGEGDLAAQTAGTPPPSPAGAPASPIPADGAAGGGQRDAAGHRAIAEAFARPARTADGAPVRLLDLAALFATLDLTAILA